MNWAANGPNVTWVMPSKPSPRMATVSPPARDSLPTGEYSLIVVTPLSTPGQAGGFKSRSYKRKVSSSNATSRMRSTFVSAARDRFDRDARRLGPRVAVDAGADRRERNRPGAEPVGAPRASGGSTTPAAPARRPPGPATRARPCGSPSEPAAGTRLSPSRRPSGIRRAIGTRPSSSGPAARWIAPSTPPPPSSDELAALTIASTARVVMSSRSASTCGIGASVRRYPPPVPSRSPRWSRSSTTFPGL